MGLTGPPPKDPSRRARRNKDTLAAAGWTILPAEGREGKPPTLPTKKPAWRKSTREWWATIWASPMATMWTDSDQGPLIRLARLVDRVDTARERSGDNSAIGQLEERFGLTPQARAKLRWRIADDTDADDSEAESAPPAAKRGRKKKPDAAAAAPADPRLKLVKGGRYT